MPEQDGSAGVQLEPGEAALCFLVAQATGARPTLDRTTNADWETIAALARRHNVVSLVHRALQANVGVSVPASARDVFDSLHRQNAIACLASTAQLGRVTQALLRSGIASIPLKGVCLSLVLYGDIAARAAGDIDILIDPAAFEETDKAIRSLGFTRLNAETLEVLPPDHVAPPDFSQHALYAVGRTLIELHFRLHKNPEFLHLTVAEILAECGTIEMGGTRLTTLSEKHQFLFLVTHGARHMWRRLQWVADIAILLRKGDPASRDRLFEAAREKGLLIAAAQAAILAHRYLDAPLPAAARQAWDDKRAVRQIVRRAEVALFGSLVDAPDEPGGFDLGVRLYRMRLCSRPSYHWHEAVRAVSVLGYKLRGKTIT